MTWFSDLSPCGYFGELAAPSLRAVGWLESGRDYSVGKANRAIYDKLVALCKDAWQPSVFAGTHGCDLCQYEPAAHGNANLFVPGNGHLFVCPVLVTHYMNAHAYLPPDEFCAAVLDCPAMRSVEYLKKLLANGGRLLLSEKSD